MNNVSLCYYFFIAVFKFIKPEMLNLKNLPVTSWQLLIVILTRF